MAKFLRYSARTLILLAIVIGLLRLTVIRWWQVPSGDPYLEASLAPALRGGDWILLWRGSAPSKGSLVLCPEPQPPYRPVIGRIAAEPTDHVQLSAGTLLVNGRAFETEGNCDRFSVLDPSSKQPVEQSCQFEILGTRTHVRGEPKVELAPPTERELTVPPGQLFLVSDNRQFPWDSREFGPVPRETCVESVFFRLVSKDGFFDVPNRLTVIR